MSDIYLPCDDTLSDCDPDVLVTQMQEERGKFSHDVSQEIQKTSHILKFAEKTKRPFPSGMGDYVKTMVLDIPSPSARDVLDHQKRLASATPGNSPCDLPSQKIPYGSHTVEACLYGWGWQTDWFCKTDLAFKYKREKQIAQVKQIMTTWASGIWNHWVWRSYQRCVRNWILAASFPSQHGASGYPLVNPTGMLTVPWLDTICQRLNDAAGMIGAPTPGTWTILIGEEECKALFDDYFQEGSEDYGVRVTRSPSMSAAKRYDADLEMEYYSLNNYRFYTECHAPRYRDRVGTETWDDALLHTRVQNPSMYGTESIVPLDYRNPDVAKYSEILIFNTESVNWLTPPAGLTENNNFHQDRHPGYSYAGDFVPVSPPEVNDPFGRKVKYLAEFVSGMESIFPNRGAAILARACHISPEIKTLTYTLSPTEMTEEVEPVRASIPILPVGTLQIETRNALPNVADGFALFLRTAGDRVVEIATATSSYCEGTGMWVHSLTFDSADAGACVPRECDQWKEVVALPEDTEDSPLLDEDGCELCGGISPEGLADICVTYVGDNIASITIDSNTISDTDADDLEDAVQTWLDTNYSGATIAITEGTADNGYIWVICITPVTAGPDEFSVEALLDGGDTISFGSDGTNTTTPAGS